MMNIFNRLKKLEQEYTRKYLLENRKKVKDENKLNAYKKQVALLRMLIRVKEEKWEASMTEHARNYLRDALELGIAGAAEKYETSKGAVRKMLCVRSKEFENKIGKTTLALIEQGKTEEATILFKQSWGLFKLDDVFLKDLLSNLELARVKDGTYVDLRECKSELKFLKLYSTSMLKEQQGNIDMQKVYSILKLIESDTTVYVEDKLLLIEFMTGGITYSEMLKKLEENE